MRSSSVYERREPGWLNRLRRLLGAEAEGKDGKEIALDQDGSPTLVVGGGQVIGVRATNGELIEIPERGPQRLEDLFSDDESDVEFVLSGGRWSKRFR